MSTYNCLFLKFNQESPYLLEPNTYFLSDINFYLYPLYLQKAFKNQDKSPKLILPYTLDDFIQFVSYVKSYSRVFLEQPFDFQTYSILDQHRLIDRILQIPKIESCVKQSEYYLSLLNVIILELGESPLGIKVEMDTLGTIKPYIHPTIQSLINNEDLNSTKESSDDNTQSNIIIIPLMYSTEKWNHASFIQVTNQSIYIFDPHGNTPLNDECYKMRNELIRSIERSTSKKVYGSIELIKDKVEPSSILNQWSNPTTFPIGMQYYETAYEEPTQKDNQSMDNDDEPIGFCNPWCLSSLEKMLKENITCVKVQERILDELGTEPCMYNKLINEICYIISERSYKFGNFIVNL